MALDTNVFDKLKTFQDYQTADRAFQLQKALQTQQLQTGAIDAASKSNIYATQVLSAATATNDQNAYDAAKRNLTSNGVDVSNWAPDVQTGAAQAQQARLAQSPLGTLFNAQQKIIGNNIAGTQAMGSQNAAKDAGFYQPTLSLGPTGNVTVTPQLIPQGTPNVSGPGMPQPPAMVDNTINQAMAAGSGRQIPQQPVAGNPQEVNADNLPATLPPANGNITLGQQQSIPRFVPPAPIPGDTAAETQRKYQQAFEAWKADPTIMQAQKQAEATGAEQGKLVVENDLAAKKAEELTNRLGMNLNAMLNLNKDLPYSGIVPAGVKTYLSQAAGANDTGDKGAAAKAANQWDQINNQQILSEIQQFIASGGANTRTNQTLERIVRAASGINRNDLPASREAQIKNALVEIQNKNVSAQNLAGGNQAYAPIPVQTSQPAAPPPGATLYGTSGGKNVYKLPNGGFIMEQ